jgi:hypothetical protein
MTRGVRVFTKKLQEAGVSRRNIFLQIIVRTYMLRTGRVFLLFGLSFLAVLLMAGCGSGVQTRPPAPNGFTNASLTGSYAFSISGSNANGFFSVAGSFQANGTGTITGGTEDFTSPAAVFTNQAVTGSYAVRSDGRTTATLTSASLTINLDFVLLNTSTGLAIRFQNTATGSGSINLQNSSAFNLAALAGPFAFNLSGVDGAGNPEGTAGLINLDTSGDIVGGSVLDDNDSGALTLNATIPITGVALSVPTGGNGRGTISFVSPVSGATVHFAYYVVDANHIKIIETDTGAIGTSFLSGDAFRQTSTTVSGNFAFTLAGATNAGTGVFTAGGILLTDGAGNVLGTSVTDINNGGTVFPAGATTGTYAVSGGRGTMTLTGAFGTVNLVFYPSSGGLLLLQVSPTILSSGTALQQSGGPFSNGSLNGGFGLNLTGADLVAGAEVDGIAQFNTTGTGTLSGAFDFNDGGVLSNSLALNGTYSISSNGRGTGTLSPSSLPALTITYYVVSSSRALFMETDANQVSVGVIALQ